MPGKGILLYSGGLDSLLAGKVLLEQGVELIGVQFIGPFAPLDGDPGKSASARYAREIGLDLRFVRCGREYMDMVEKPLHGYGKNMNPCIDCKIYFLRKAKAMMEAEGAMFVATGEVMGQRPMSQKRHMLKHIEKESGLQGRLLRPLCARLMTETEAEKTGDVDRSRLLAISGRSRHRQMELAEKYGISEYNSPAGGCQLTDVNIARRVRDLFTYIPDFSMVDVYLIAVGRHFRLHDGLKVIVGRNQVENDELEKYGRDADCLAVPDFKGPVLFARGAVSEEDAALMGKICARYGRPVVGDDSLVLKGTSGETKRVACNETISGDLLDRMRI